MEKILRAVSCAVITTDLILSIFIDPIAVELIILVILRVFTHIFQSRHNFKGGPWRIQSLERTV